MDSYPQIRLLLGRVLTLVLVALALSVSARAVRVEILFLTSGAHEEAFHNGGHREREEDALYLLICSFCFALCLCG